MIEPWRHSSLLWEPNGARVVEFTTKAIVGTVRLAIVLEVDSPWELGDLTRQLLELKNAGIAARDAARPARKGGGK